MALDDTMPPVRDCPQRTRLDLAHTDYHLIHLRKQVFSQNSRHNITLSRFSPSLKTISFDCHQQMAKSRSLFCSCCLTRKYVMINVFFSLFSAPAAKFVYPHHHHKGSRNSR